MKRGLKLVESDSASEEATGSGRPSRAHVEALVERAQAGQHRAWVKLYQLYYHPVLSRVYYLVGGQHSAEDITQDVFVVAFRKLDSFEGRSTFSTWLFGVAGNVVRNHWRAQRTKDRAMNRLRAEPGPELERPLDLRQSDQDRARALLGAVEQLPDNLREAFSLVELEGCSRAEAGEQLGISPNNVGVRVHRAKKRLVAILNQAGWEIDG